MTISELLTYGCAGLSTAIFVWLLVNLYNKFDFNLSAAEGEYEEAPFILKALLPCARTAGIITIDMLGRDRDYVRNYSERISRMILMAGEPAGLGPVDFTGLSVVGACLGAVCGLIIYSMAGNWAGALILGCSILGMILPYVWINDRIKDRQRQIRRGLPYCLDLVTLAVEAGMDFTTALQIVGGKLSVPALVSELKRTLRAIQMGKIRSEALRDMGRRVNVPELSSVTSAIIQADELGANLGPILRIQSEQIRTKRFQMAEKLAMQAPVKILLPLIAFLFPTTLIVIFGPLVAGFLARRFS